MKKKQTGIRDIARILNLSPSTVSKALKGAEEIRPRTRKLVQEMARQLDYEPNQVAKGLRSGKSYRLGVIVPNLVTHFFSASISGIQDAAVQMGYNIIVGQSNESYQKEVSVLQTLISSQVDGILISLSQETDNFTHLKSLANRGIPLVLFDRTCDEIEATKVIVDDHDGAFKATKHLIDMGYKRIAHLAGPDHLSISKDRLQGYLDALMANGLPVREELICHSNLLREEVEQQTRQLLSLAEPPDAIFAINDVVATQAMLVIRSMGLKIPQDIALMGFTNIPDAALLDPSLTTMAQPAYQLGHLATTHIINQINNPDQFIPQTIVLKTELIIRESTLRAGHLTQKTLVH